METALLNTPIGSLHLFASEAGIRRIEFETEKPVPQSATPEARNPHLSNLLLQLEAYFSGSLSRFSCTLDAEGTPFQKRVWQALSEIPFGSTKSYGEIAAAIGQPNASRAVGMANNKNPIPIVVPCHRVIGSSQKLVGFGGGLWRKQWLLEHEGIVLPLGL